jgi:pimeloyl-ACP methyl ester carboxylesterase
MIRLWRILAGALLSLVANVAAAQQVGVILMHGKWGTPNQGIAPVASELRSAGFLVESPEMAWSDKRAYDTNFDQVMAVLEGEVAKLRAAGAAKIVLGGQSFGANIALGYGARHADAAGIIALSPGHTPERFGPGSGIPESVAKARAMLAAGRGGEYANFEDTNQGRHREVSARPGDYLSFFDPKGPCVMPENAARLSPRTALLWVVGTEDPMFREGRGYAFDRAPTNPHSAFHTVQAGHFDAPSAARSIVLEWVRGLP